MPGTLFAYGVKGRGSEGWLGEGIISEGRRKAGK